MSQTRRAAVAQRASEAMRPNNGAAGPVRTSVGGERRSDAVQEDLEKLVGVGHHREVACARDEDHGFVRSVDALEVPRCDLWRGDSILLSIDDEEWNWHVISERSQIDALKDQVHLGQGEGQVAGLQFSKVMQRLFRIPEHQADGGQQIQPVGGSQIAVEPRAHHFFLGVG